MYNGRSTWRNSPKAKKHALMIAFVFFLFIALADADKSSALPFDFDSTNQQIDAGSWSKVYNTLDSGDTLSGYFETHSSTQGLKFFICDQENLDLWEG